MKPTTEIITRARSHVAELASSAHWTETHLYCAMASFQDGEVGRSQKELDAAKRHVLKWRRKVTALLHAIDESYESTK